MIKTSIIAAAANQPEPAPRQPSAFDSFIHVLGAVALVVLITVMVRALRGKP